MTRDKLTLIDNFASSITVLYLKGCISCIYLTLDELRRQSLSSFIWWTLGILCLITWLLDRSEVLFCFQVCDRRRIFKKTFVLSHHFYKNRKWWSGVNTDKRRCSEGKNTHNGRHVFKFETRALEGLVTKNGKGNGWGWQGEVGAGREKINRTYI